MKNSEKAEYRSAEKAAVVRATAQKSRQKQRRPKPNEKTKSQGEDAAATEKRRLEVLVFSNKEQLCLVEATFYSFPSPAHPPGLWHLFYDSDHNAVLRRKYYCSK